MFVLSFQWYGESIHMYGSSLVHNGFYIFTSDVIPVDLLAARMVVETL